MDTIFALSSGAPPSGVAVFRISGAAAFGVSEALCGSEIKPRVASLRKLNAAGGELIDTAIVIGFKAPSSFTGEDVVELHVHGSRAVVAQLTSELTGRIGCRPAKRGEFAERAFINGKMDLTEAEGLADLIDAETREQKRLAQEQSEGSVRRQLERWKEELLEMRAFLEAGIDFADEEDIGDAVDADVSVRVQHLLEEMKDALAGSSSRSIIRDGALVVLVGAPNSGKSSLLNALVGEDRAIVSNVAGTTRDYVEVRLDLGGYLVRLVDTAGLRSTNDEIERAGISKTEELIQRADIVVELSPDGVFSVGDLEDAAVVRVHSKSDLRGQGSFGDLSVSVRDSGSLNHLDAILTDQIKFLAGGGAQVSLNERQASLLVRCTRILDGYNPEELVEARADLLQRAMRVIGEVVGDTHIDDVLGAVFSRFCIGK
ncbi:MAG: tRNA uridine-5-carboxymethylaminomethyl(34) synthesis GTPase MnmE [Pseudomonadota bacterium]